MNTRVPPEIARRWPLQFWLLGLLAPVVFLGLMHLAESRSALGNEWRITTADFLASTASRPPAAEQAATDKREASPWRSIALSEDEPCDWKLPCSGWLRIPLPIAAPASSATANSEWILLIPKPNQANFSLWLSGVRFGGAGEHTPAGASMPQNPVSLSFPQLALRNGETHIFLHVTSELGGIGPNTLYLGPASELRGYSNRVIFFQKTLIRAILLMMGVMAVVMFLIHLLRRSHTTLYGWYSLGIVLWFVHTLQVQHESANFGSVWFWTRTTYVTLAAYVVGAVIFVNRLTEQPQPRLEGAMLLALIAGATFILIDPVGVEGILRFNVVLWIPALIAAGIYMLVRIITGARRNPEREILLLLAATFLGVSVGVRDYLYKDLQLLPDGMLYSRHAAGLILVAYSFVMIRRFAESYRLSDATLPQQPPPEVTAEVTAELVADPVNSQRALLQQEHDSLERQLQQAVLNIEPSEETAQFNSNMRAARHDLQLIRDSMDRNSNSPPGELLTSMQDRLARSAERQRVNLLWQTPLITNTAFIADHFEVALARFVQTATLEALAFSGAASVEVSARIEVAPQGSMQFTTVTARFADPSRSDFGKRAQMEAAARELRGKLVFSRTQDNCQVELAWSMPG